MMKKPLFIALVLGLFITACGTVPDTAEPHADKVLGDILAARDAIRAISPSPPLFVTFWDFDGTILLGDCSLGHRENGAQLYRGLAEEAITRGFSARYGKDEYRAFAKKYLGMDSRGSHGEAAVYIARVFSGAKAAELLDLSREHFSIMSRFYFSSSMRIIRKLRAEGIGIYVLSASPEFFVDGAAATTGIPEEMIFGIRTAGKDGRVTEKVLEPVTYGAGKTKMLLEILARLRKENPGREVYVLAGFGNSYHTDGEFLKWIARQRLPAARPVAVMINGGKVPARFANTFTTVRQSKTEGGASPSR
jgi:phosphoserine phosphatase